MVNDLESVTEERSQSFDAARARQIRMDSGLDVRELARNLNFRRGSNAAGWGAVANAIYYYEKGTKQPNSASSEIAKTYLGWLKEQGYNSFNL